MSGLHQHNTGCLANSVGAGCDGPVARGWEAEAMAVHMQRAGYLTGFWVRSNLPLPRQKLKMPTLLFRGSTSTLTGKTPPAGGWLCHRAGRSGVG